MIEAIKGRVQQEGLSNVARHANARSVSVRLVHDGAALDLEVRDDGRGLAGATGSAHRSQGLDSGLGLAGMAERLGALGGTMVIGDAADGGARLTVRLPLAQIAV